MIKTILLVDDHPAVRFALKAQLGALVNVKQILEAGDGKAALDAMRQHDVNLVILDLDIPKINGMEVIPRLRAINPNVKILVLSSYSADVFAPRAVRAGANGYVNKTQEILNIIRCTEAIMAGYMVFPPGIDLSPKSGTPEEEDARLVGGLTGKELLVFQMLARGMSNKSIGESMFISNKTVSTHKTHIMRKLKVSTLVDLVDLARRSGVQSES